MKENNTIFVSEIFGPTIQGEGPNVGMKSIFIRVTGCDFKCDWCDSKFAWDINKDSKKYIDIDLANTVLEKCNLTNTCHVILTGGNPCLYNFSNFIDILNTHNIKIDVETQGSILPKWLEQCNQIVISPKPPSSNQKDVFSIIKNWLFNTPNLPPIAIKIPIFDLVDFNFIFQYYRLIKEVKNHNIKLYISIGNSDTKESGDISSRILNSYSNFIDILMNSTMDDVYILPQIHTLVWGNKQGV